MAASLNSASAPEIHLSRRSLFVSAPAAAAVALIPAAAGAIPAPQGDPEFALKLAAYRHASEAVRAAVEGTERQYEDLGPMPSDRAALDSWRDAHDEITESSLPFLHEQDRCALDVIMHPAHNLADLREKIVIIQAIYLIGHDKGLAAVDAVFRDVLNLSDADYLNGGH